MSIYDHFQSMREAGLTAFDGGEPVSILPASGKAPRVVERAVVRLRSLEMNSAADGDNEKTMGVILVPADQAVDLVPMESKIRLMRENDDRTFVFTGFGEDNAAYVRLNVQYVQRGKLFDDRLEATR